MPESNVQVSRDGKVGIEENKSKQGVLCDCDLHESFEIFANSFGSQGFSEGVCNLSQGQNNGKNKQSQQWQRLFDCEDKREIYFGSLAGNVLYRKYHGNADATS